MEKESVVSDRENKGAEAIMAKGEAGPPLPPPPLKSARYDDIYFSAQGGLAEKDYIFVGGNGLPGRWEGRQAFTICETGFGTGLSFLAAWRSFSRTALAGQRLDYIGIEKDPLAASEILSVLRGWREEIGGGIFDRFLENYPLRTPGYHRILFPEGEDGRGGACATLTLIFADVNEALPDLDVPGGVDAWFLDGFTPAKNPEMWGPVLFSEMARLSAPGARCATFTVAGVVRRGLESAGFRLEKRPGFGRKNEMLAGVLGT